MVNKLYTLMTDNKNNFAVLFDRTVIYESAPGVTCSFVIGQKLNAELETQQDINTFSEAWIADFDICV